MALDDEKVAFSLTISLLNVLYFPECNHNSTKECESIPLVWQEEYAIPECNPHRFHYFIMQ